MLDAHPDVCFPCLYKEYIYIQQKNVLSASCKQEKQGIEPDFWSGDWLSKMLTLDTPCHHHSAGNAAHPQQRSGAHLPGEVHQGHQGTNTCDTNLVVAAFKKTCCMNIFVKENRSELVCNCGKTSSIYWWIIMIPIFNGHGFVGQLSSDTAIFRWLCILYPLYPIDYYNIPMIYFTSPS